MQLIFGDAQEPSKRKRREVFIEDMDQVVPWKLLLARIVLFNPNPFLLIQYASGTGGIVINDAGGLSFPCL